MVINAKRSEKIYNYLILIIASTLIFSMQFRIGILGGALGSVNYLSIPLICLLFFNIKTNTKYFFWWYVISCYYIISSYYVQQSLFDVAKSYISFIFPLIIISLEIDRDTFLKFFKKFLNIFNTIMILITIFGVCDLLIGSKIILFLSKFMGGRIKELIEIQSTRDVFRMYSFLGHPLFNTQLYLIYYILNVLYKKYYGDIIKSKYIYLVTLIGISLTASKSGLLLYIVSIILLNPKRIKFKHIVLGIIGTVIVLKIGIFDNTITRLLTESLTTGRAEKWVQVNELNLYPIKFLTGYGTGFAFYYNSILDWASAAFEYPVRLFSLEQGKLMMLMIYSCIFIYPSVILFMRKQFTLVKAYMIIFIDVNTFNGIAVIGDYMLIFCIFILIILNISSDKIRSMT